MNVKKIGVLLSMMTLSGCSFLSPVKTGPETGYVINKTPANVVKSRRHSAVLLVMNPDINPVYNSTRLAYTVRPYQITYYSSSHWVDTPSQMFAPLIAQTLQKTNRFKSIVTPPFTGQYHYALRTQIKTLLIDYTRTQPALQLTIQAQIISGYNGNLLSSRDFSAAIPLPQHSPYGAVYAANCAAEKVLREMAAWVVKSTRY